jgi:hypothetical protein
VLRPADRLRGGGQRVRPRDRRRLRHVHGSRDVRRRRRLRPVRCASRPLPHLELHGSEHRVRPRGRWLRRTPRLRQVPGGADLRGWREEGTMRGAAPAADLVRSDELHRPEHRVRACGRRLRREIQCGKCPSGEVCGGSGKRGQCSTSAQ